MASGAAAKEITSLGSKSIMAIFTYNNSIGGESDFLFLLGKVSKEPERKESAERTEEI